MAFTLTSTAFSANGRIPARYTCDGADMSPPLAWFGAPAETKSFAIVCADPDAPAGTWYHWAVYDIPAAVSGLAEQYPADMQGGFLQAVNDFGRGGYGGPCPPHGHGTHHYRFRVYAVNRATLRLTKPHSRDVERTAQANAIAWADLVGLYGR